MAENSPRLFVLDTNVLMHDPAALSAEIGRFLKTVSFAIDTTMIGLSAAMVMEAMNKVREILYGNRKVAAKPEK